MKQLNYNVESTSEEKIVLDNIKLIYKCIKDMHCFWRTDDEFQNYYDAGLEGLIRGAKTYNSNIAKPSTYLITCIRHSIARYIYVSEQNNKKINKEIMTSLDEMVSFDSETTIGELIPDDGPSVEEKIEKKIKMDSIIKELNSMKNQKDALAIKMYYGLEGRTPKTYEEISKEFGVSRERIGQIIARGIRKLKEKKDFLERNLLSEQEEE